MSRNATATLRVTFAPTSKHPDGRVRSYPLVGGSAAEVAEATLAQHAANYVRTPVSVSVFVGDTLVMSATWAPKLAWKTPAKAAKTPQVASPVAPIAPAKPKARKVLETLANGRTVRVPLTHSDGSLYTAAQAKVWASTYKAQRDAGTAPVGAIMRATKAAA